MKRIQLTLSGLLAVVAIYGLSSCRFGNCKHGSGNQITINRRVADFTRLQVSDSFKVIIKQDSSGKQDSSSTINITADDNLMKYIRTTVSGGRLRIYTRQNMCNSGEMIVKVPVRMLQEISTSDAGEVTADGKIKAQDMYFKLSDGSRITIDLNATHVITHGTDASELNLKGQAASHEIEISDGSKIFATDFVSGTCTVQASDGSQSDLNVLNTLSVNASDGAVIKYRGSPPVVNSKKSDGASVEKVN